MRLQHFLETEHLHDILAISAYLSESVETCTVVKQPERIAARMEYAISGFPFKGLIFLSRNPLDWLRAGISARFLTMILPPL